MIFKRKLYEIYIGQLERKEIYTQKLIIDEHHRRNFPRKPKGCSDKFFIVSKKIQIILSLAKIQRKSQFHRRIIN